MGARDPDRIAWRDLRDTIDLASVASDLLGPAPGRRGANGRRMWWLCPLHEDKNPSFCVTPGSPRWRCYGCGEAGDAAALVMKLRGISFPEALAYLAATPGPLVKSSHPGGRVPRQGRLTSLAMKTTGLAPGAAAVLVAKSVDRLWSREGEEARGYLTGPERCLGLETIRDARLGWIGPGVDGVPWKAPGVVVPWFAGPRLALVKVRPPDSWRERQPAERQPPKYVEAFRDPAALTFYPGREAIRPGRPLVIVEGEFDALCLGEALKELAAVITLGSASVEPSPSILRGLLAAAPWYVATDRDEAGTEAAGRWPASARRVLPPGSFKDWTEAKAGGVDLARWWGEILSGNDRPSLFTWAELSQPCKGGY